MSADDIRNSASKMTRAELIEAQQLCQVELAAWDDAYDAVNYYLEQYRLRIKGKWGNRE